MRTLASAAQLIAVLSIVLAFGSPAQAHHGGAGAGAPPELVVNEAFVVPDQEGWLIGATVRDATSGKPMPGYGVEVRGSAGETESFDPVGLADPDADGHYEGRLPLRAGSWMLTIEANELPGGEPAEAFAKTWSVKVEEGRGVNIVGSSRHLAHHVTSSASPAPAASAGSTSKDRQSQADGSGSNAIVFGAVAAGGLLAIAGTLAYRRRLIPPLTSH